MAVRSILPAVALVALLCGCAPQGSFPSLAPRPVEWELSGQPPPPCLAGQSPPAAETAQQTGPAADPQLAARVASLLADARRGESDFAKALPAARTSVGRAGPAGSESWIAAQQNISALEAARARTADAVAELDALLLARSGDEATSQTDREAVAAAAEEARRLAEAQQAELERLNAAISAPEGPQRGHSQARHNAPPPPAGRQALPGSARAHSAQAAPPRAAPRECASRG